MSAFAPSSAAPSSAAPSCAIEGVADRRRVLVADNDAIIRSVLRSLLTKVGQIVEPAASSDEALRLAARTRFDCVILDLDMPTEGGLQVCRRLRNDVAYAQVPIVILTALDHYDARTRSTQAGASLFVAKPFNPAELMRRLVPYLHVADPDRHLLAEVLAGDRGLRLQDAMAGAADLRLPAR